jgi:ribosome-associated protein
MSEIEQATEERKEQLAKVREQTGSEDVLSLLLHALDDKKVQDIFCARVDGVTTIADYMIVASGTSSRHCSVLYDSVRKAARKIKLERLNPNEVFNETWSLLDYGTVIVNIMSNEGHGIYKLDELWSKGEVLDAKQFMSEHPCDLFTLPKKTEE